MIFRCYCAKYVFVQSLVLPRGRVKPIESRVFYLQQPIVSIVTRLLKAARRKSKVNKKGISKRKHALAFGDNTMSTKRTDLLILLLHYEIQTSELSCVEKTEDPKSRE